MATNIPPHNLTVNARLAVLEDQDITVDGLLEHIQGPDFPTGGIINGRAGIVQAYRTGRGRIYCVVEPRWRRTPRAAKKSSLLRYRFS